MRKLLSAVFEGGADTGRVVIRHGGRTYTRRQARDAVTNCAAGLRRLGIRPGERVLALVDHDPRGVFFLAAASGLGLRVVMPHNLESAAVAEWADIAAQARLDHIVSLKADAAGPDTLRKRGVPVARLGAFEDWPAPAGGFGPWWSTQPVEGFLVLFGSGTSGAPKAMSISEELICRRVAGVATRLAFGPDARILMSGLLNNTTGVTFSFGALDADAALIFPESRDVSGWASQVRSDRISHLMLRPVAMRRFVDALDAERWDVSSLQVVAYGAAPMAASLLERGRRLMPCDWVQGYGLSETFGPFCWLDEGAHRSGLHRRYRYNVGTPDGTVEVQVLPVDGLADGMGEVAVRADTVMDGYLDVDRDRVTPPAEWFRTGDIAEWAPDGSLLLKGRLSESVLSESGERVYPEEVEAALLEVPGVEDAVVVGMSLTGADGERPVALLHGPLAWQPADHITRVVAGALSPILSPDKWPEFIYPARQLFASGPNAKVRRSEVRASIVEEALIPFDHRPVGVPR